MKEIERKFLVKNTSFQQLAKPEFYSQGYLSDEEERIVRIRIAGEKAFLTIKGKTESISRLEYEYEIPVEDADVMLKALCLKPTIEKYRYKIPQKELCWEVDVFLGENEGLIVAEIELPSEDYPFDIPEWVGEEVSFDAKYYNANLIKNPYKNW